MARVIAPEEVTGLSRAITSEPIASDSSGSSSASVDRYLSVLMSLAMLRRTKDSFKVSSK